MAAVFATQQNFAGGFRADQLTMSVSGVELAGMLVQSVQYTYNQQVAMLYELGSSNVYFVGGRAQGNCAIQHVAGPARLSGILLQTFRDLCVPQELAMAARTGCGNTFAAMSIKLQDAVLVGFGGAVAAQDTIINQNLQLMFINMDAGDAGEVEGTAL